MLMVTLSTVTECTVPFFLYNISPMSSLQFMYHRSIYGRDEDPVLDKNRFRGSAIQTKGDFLKSID